MNMSNDLVSVVEAVVRHIKGSTTGNRERDQLAEELDPVLKMVARKVGTRYELDGDDVDELHGVLLEWCFSYQGKRSNPLESWLDREDRGSLRGYIYKGGLYRAQDWIKAWKAHRKRYVSSEKQDAEEWVVDVAGHDPLEVLERLDDIKNVHEILRESALSSEQQAVLKRTFFKRERFFTKDGAAREQVDRDIAEELGVEVGTVASLRWRALRRLAANTEQRYPGFVRTAGASKRSVVRPRSGSENE